MSEKQVAIQQPKIIQNFATRYHVDENQVSTILRQTAFKQSDRDVSPAEMAALLVVADQYNLNPFTREIYAFFNKQSGAIIPIVGVDGWMRKMLEHPQYNGHEYSYSPDMVTIGKSKPCFEWIEISISRKDREKPIVIREFFDECYNGFSFDRSPWNTHPKRFLRHKVTIQGARVGFGFAGIYDEDEAERITESEIVSIETIEKPDSSMEIIAETAIIEPVPQPTPEPEKKKPAAKKTEPIPEPIPEPEQNLLPEEDLF